MMDVEKAVRAMRDSLKHDIDTKNGDDKQRLTAEYEAKLAELEMKYQEELDKLNKELDEDPVGFMARHLKKKEPSKEEVPGASKKRARVSEGAASGGTQLDGADERDQPVVPKRGRVSEGAGGGGGGGGDQPAASKRGRVSKGANAEQATKGRPKRIVKPAPSRDYGAIIAPTEPTTTKKTAPTRANATPSVTTVVNAQTDTTQPQQPQPGQLSLDLQFAHSLLTTLLAPHLYAIAAPFQHPVSFAANPDYYRTIKTPMDLNTMKLKLEMGKYQSAEDFKRDFELMIQNCNDYNPVGHPLRECGVLLRRHFEEGWGGRERWVRNAMREKRMAEEEKEDV